MVKPTHDVCIVGGLGHVGLPLGISLADAGRRVVLYDTNRDAARTVATGHMPFLERGAEDVLRRVLGKSLTVSGDREAVGGAHFVVIVIGTPVDDHLNPEFGAFRDLFSGVLGQLHDGQHVLLRSTVLPGTTAWVRDYLQEHRLRVKLSYCPERISEGNAMDELRSLPQIVAAFDADSEREAKELFSLLTPDIIPLRPQEAELAKLFTNAWRYVQFAIANQFFQIATRDGLDFYRIRDAITYKYPRTEQFPRAGFAAGPCLFKDTMQLAAHCNNSFFLGHAAMLVNEGLPNHIVEELKRKMPLNRKVVGILGMAFKANSDDARSSLSYKLKKILEVQAAEVLCSDPLVRDERLVSAEDLVARADVIILGVPHDAYRTLVIPEGKGIVDVWNFLGKGSLV